MTIHGESLWYPFKYMSKIFVLLIGPDIVEFCNKMKNGQKVPRLYSLDYVLHVL